METNIEELIEKLHHPRDWRVRQDVVKALGDYKSKEALSALTEALYDESPHVVRTATQSLSHFGTEAISELLEALYSPKEIAARPFIIHALRKFNDHSLLPHFIHFLTDENPEMQYAAAVALKHMPDESAIQPLLDVLNPDSPVRKEVIEALGAIANPVVVSHVGPYLYDRHTCRATARLLGNSGISQAESMLLDASHSDSADVRAAVVEGLGTFNSDKAYERIVEMLNDTEARVRPIAIHALGRTQRDHAVTILISILNTNNSRDYPYVRGALGDAGDLRAVFPLLRGFRQDTDHDGRDLSDLAANVWNHRSNFDAVLPGILTAMQGEDERLKILALWVFHDVSFKYAKSSEINVINAQLEHLDIFEELLASQNPDLRLVALVCLAHDSLPKLSNQIIGCLDDDDVLIQKMAAKALGFIETAIAISSLIKVIGRANDGIRYEAIHSLIRIGGNQVETFLLSLIDHKDMWTRRLAVNGLGRLKSKEAYKPLQERLHKEADATVKGTILWSLRDIGGSETNDEVVTVLREEDESRFIESPFEMALMAFSDPNSSNEEALDILYKVVNKSDRWQRRMYAVEALSRIGSDQEVADRMFRLLDHDDDTVRTTAAKQLGFLGSRTNDLDLREYIVSKLAEYLQDDGLGYHASPTVAHMAAKSLYFIGTTQAITVLKQWDQSRQKGKDDNK